MEKLTEIQKTFSNSSVLLTGATGFMGKLLTEKLLRSCFIKRIYLVIRTKKNKNPTERMSKLLNDVVFDRLKHEDPFFEDRVTVISGDIIQINVGISDSDLQEIRDNVNFVFHVAASVHFERPFKDTVESNVRGTREILALAKTFVDLRAFVHVSTAYIYCPFENQLREEFYPPPIPSDDLINFVQNIKEDTINDIAPKLIKPFPNFYSYSKLIGEDVVRNHSEGMPVCVVRPSIVMGTAKEPVPGWSDNVFGPNGVCLYLISDLVMDSALAFCITLSKKLVYIRSQHNLPWVVMVCVSIITGWTRVARGDPNCTVDLVPGDMAINTCIAAAWQTATRRLLGTLPAVPTIYVAGTSTSTPLVFKKLLDICNYNYTLAPSTHAIYLNKTLWISSNFWYKVAQLMFHTLPAHLIDGVMYFIGKKAGIATIYKKIDNLLVNLSYFCSNEWRFHNPNTKQLYSALTNEDKEIFNFDFDNLNWEEYLNDYMKGTRLYLLKESLNTLPAAKRRRKLLYILHYFMCINLLIFLSKLGKEILNLIKSRL